MTMKFWMSALIVCVGCGEVTAEPISSTSLAITRVDIVARGVIKGCLEAGKDPAETIAIFRIPGAWEEEGFKILKKYGVDFCDRSVSMYDAAGRAVAKLRRQGGK